MSSITSNLLSPVKLNPTPIEPDSRSISSWLENEESVITSQVDQWINAHHKYYRSALKALSKNIVRIKHAQFKGALHKAVGKFNKDLSQVEDKSYTVLVQPGKSNQWVAELALKYVAAQPSESLPLGEKQARDYCDYLDTLSRTDEIARRIVLFDDASYSGTQLTEHVKTIFEKFKALGLETPTVHVVAPFATSHAYKKLKNLPEYADKLLKLSIYGKINSVADVLSKEQTARLAELYDWTDDPMEVEGRGIIYFDHKIPNGMSFVEPFATGCVFPGKGGHQLSGNKIDSTHYTNLPPIKPPYKS